MWLTHISKLVNCLVCRPISVIVMKVRHVFCNIWVSEGRCCASANLTINIFNSNLYPIGKSIYVFWFTRCPLSGITLDGIHKNLKFCFQLMNLGSPYFGHLTNKSYRSVVGNVHVTSYNVASWITYEWELAQVQPGGLDLKSSMLRSCNTCLQSQILVAISAVYVYEIIGLLFDGLYTRRLMSTCFDVYSYL